MQKRFQFFKPPGGEVVVAVAGEAEVDQFPQLFALAVGHECCGKLSEGRAEIRTAGLGVGFEVTEVILHREREQRHAVVEDRRKRARLIGTVVDQQSEVAEVPVDVIHQRVEDHHVAERLIELLAHAL